MLSLPITRTFWYSDYEEGVFLFWYGQAPKKETSSRIAVIAGDGVGPEVVEAGMDILHMVQTLDPHIQLQFDKYPWGSDYFRAHGQMLPSDGIKTLAAYDAIYFGAVGDPTLPLHVPIWGLILPIRQAFDAYVNLRPVMTLDPNDAASSIHMLIVRENTEGEYVGQGGRLYRGTPRETAIQLSSFSREGVARVCRYALQLARISHLTCTSVTKSNALNYTGVLWDEIFEEVGRDYPDVERTSMLVDAAAMVMVKNPQRFEVMVTSNLFGDILSDLGAGLVGGLGLAPSANFNPSHLTPGVFEPVHGSAPDIAGKGLANPMGAILSAAMMLGYLGHSRWEDWIFEAVRRALTHPNARTPDLGGTANTPMVTQQVGEALQQVFVEQVGTSPTDVSKP